MGADPRERAIIERIELQTGLKGLYDSLSAAIPLSDLQSLLLAVYRQRVAAVHPSDLLRRYEQSRFTRLSAADPTEALRFDALAFRHVPVGYQPVELSPVSPLGCSSVLGPVSQNNVVTTVRNCEVVSDSTNVLALECALRRKGSRDRPPQAEIKLCSSHRLLRAQPFEGPVSFAHFRLLGLCHARRDTGNKAFEAEALVEQTDFYLRVLKAARADGWAVGSIQVRLIDIGSSLTETLASAVRPRIVGLHPDVELVDEQTAATPGGYYQGLRFNIHATTVTGESLFLVDGGLTNWTQKLLNSRKERLMTSGMGTERFLIAFGPQKISGAR